MSVQEEHTNSQIPGKAAVPWKWIVGLLLLGLLWTSGWLYYELGRPRKPKVEPVKEVVVTLPKQIVELCSLIETKRPALVRSLMSREESLSDKEREKLLERAVAHALTKGSASGYVPLLVKHREATFQALRPYLSTKNEAKAINALEIFSELYVDVVTGWRKEAKKEHRQLIYDLLSLGLDKPTKEPELTIRVIALGIIDRARDTTVMPLLRKITTGEPNKLRKAKLTQLMDKLQAIKQSNRGQ